MANLIFGHGAEVIARLLLDSLQDRQTAVWCLEVHDIIANLHLGGAVYGNGNLLQQLLGEGHHPVVVLVLYIELHTSKLWIVGAVHTLVAEVTTNLVNALKTTYDEALEVEFGSNTHVHIHVQSVVVGNERTSRCTTCNSLQHWCLHLSITRFVKHLTHGADNRCTLEEDVLYTFVHHEVHITLTVALLWVVEAVVCHTVFVFHDREWAERFSQHGEFLCVYADLAHLGAEYKALDTYEVTYIKQFLEDYVVHLLLHGGSRLSFWSRGLDIVAADIYLDTTFGVLNLYEGSFAHDTTRHHTTRNAHRLARVPLSIFGLFVNEG